MPHYKTDKTESYCGITEASIAKKDNPSWNHWKLPSLCTEEAIASGWWRLWPPVVERWCNRSHVFCVHVMVGSWLLLWSGVHGTRFAFLRGSLIYDEKTLFTRTGTLTRESSLLVVLQRQPSGAGSDSASTWATLVPLSSYNAPFY